MVVNGSRPGLPSAARAIENAFVRRVSKRMPAVLAIGNPQDRPTFRRPELRPVPAARISAYGIRPRRTCASAASAGRETAPQRKVRSGAARISESMTRGVKNGVQVVHSDLFTVFEKRYMG